MRVPFPLSPHDAKSFVFAPFVFLLDLTVSGFRSVSPETAAGRFCEQIDESVPALARVWREYGIRRADLGSDTVF